MEDDRSYLKHLLSCWSKYHPKAAMKLCSNEVAAEVLSLSADADVQCAANLKKASQQCERLSLVSMCASSTLLATTDL